MKTIDLTIPIYANNTPDYNFTVFTRKNGVSSPPFDSCNASFGVGDSNEAVLANRQLIKESLGLKKIISSRQVHGDQIFIAKENLNQDIETDGYDALITDCPHTGLMIQQADCQAVMLYDPIKRVIANVHAGWRGSVLNIVGKTIQAMANEFGSASKNIRAAISPSLGPCCAEFINYKKELPDHFHPFQGKTNHFDFWAISRDQLCMAGLLQKNIRTANICTVCDTTFFSYRRDKITGRFCSVVSIRDN